MVDRIRALLAFRQLTPTQFADLIQVGRPIISHILSGRNKASLDVVQRIMAAFPEVALPWLLSGTGPMLMAAEATPVGAPATTQVLSLEEEATAPPHLTAPVPVQPAEAPSQAAQAAASVVGRGSSRVAAASSPGPTGATTAGKTATNHRLKPFKASGLPTLAPPPSPSGRQPPRFRVNKPKANDSSATPPSATASDLNSATPDSHLAAAELAAPVAAVTTLVPATAKGSAAGDDNAGSGSAATMLLSSPSLAQAKNEAKTPSAAANDTAVSPVAPFISADKAIRRIVIFYHDGSFTDFQPEI